MKGLSLEQLDEAVDRYERGNSLMRVGHALGVTSNQSEPRCLSVGSSFESVPAGGDPSPPLVDITSKSQLPCNGSGLGSSDTTVRRALPPAGCSMSPLPPGVLIGDLLVTAQSRFIGARHSLANTD